MLISEVVDTLKSGGLKSMEVDGFCYIPMRLTGLGKTERAYEDGGIRIVDRREDLFTAPKLMEQYANLPILLEHPKNKNGEHVGAGLDNSEHFIGNTVAAFIKEIDAGRGVEKEIWVIGKIYDRATLDLILQHDLSTSPHFISREVKENDYFVEIPLDVNHLAIVYCGYWDKKSIIPAIDIDNNYQNESEVSKMENEDKRKDFASVNENKTDTAIIEGGGDEIKIDEDLKENDKKPSLDASGKVDDDRALEDAKAKVDEDLELDDEKIKKIVEQVLKSLPVTHQPVEEEVKIDEDLIESEEQTEEDLERDELIGVITDIVDNSPKELGLKSVYFGTKRYKPAVVVNKFAAVNKGFVNKENQGLINKIDSSTMKFGKMIIDNIRENVNKKAMELNKPALNAGVVRNAQGLNEYKIW